MVTYPLDEILLATPGLFAGRTTGRASKRSRWGVRLATRFLPFTNGIPTAQTWRKVFRLLDAQAKRGFAAWAASMRVAAREVIAVDGKTLRGSKT